MSNLLFAKLCAGARVPPQILDFSKYEGAGNDFILIDNREKRSFSRLFIQNICQRKFGIGADGIILLEKDLLADFRMRIFNADGSEAESCGNGLRCLYRFILSLGLPAKKYAIATGKGIVFADLDGKNVAVDMGKPSDYQSHLETVHGPLHLINTGVPHGVLFFNEVETRDLATLGRPLRHQFNANINIASHEKEGCFRVRTFERGVEGETLACGTGAVAVAAVAQKLSLSKGPYTLSFSGGELRVREEGGRFWMSGPAKLIFTGKISAEI